MCVQMIYMGNLMARVLEWVAISFSNCTQYIYVHCRNDMYCVHRDTTATKQLCIIYLHVYIHIDMCIYFPDSSFVINFLYLLKI